MLRPSAAANPPFNACPEGKMDERQRRLQVVIWFLLPILGLLLLVVVLAGRGGIFVLVPVVGLIALGAIIAWMLVRGQG
jgi:hypothetical protein